MKKLKAKTALPKMTAALSAAFGVAASVKKSDKKQPVLTTHWYV